MSQTLLQVSGLNTYYGASHVLHDLDFKVQQGQTIGLMGRNGMGKSTLLKSITGLLKPRSGRIEFQNTGIHGKTPYEIALLGMAYVPQGREIFPALSVTDNLRMGLVKTGQQLVKDKKQRDLKLDGDIKLKFWPSIGADLGKMSLSEFKSDKEFAAVDGLRVGVAQIMREIRANDDQRFSAAP